MKDQIPESNGDVVALNIVDHAMVGEINHPGEGLAGLLLKMATMARDIGGDHRAASSDWHESIANITNEGSAAISGVIERQALALGDTWAKRWMIALLAKHLYEGLERRCLQSTASPAIALVEYDDDGSLRTWKLRKK